MYVFTQPLQQDVTQGNFLAEYSWFFPIFLYLDHSHIKIKEPVYPPIFP